jgi:hypothetical protein
MWQAWDLAAEMCLLQVGAVCGLNIRVVSLWWLRAPEIKRQAAWRQFD